MDFFKKYFLVLLGPLSFIALLLTPCPSGLNEISWKFIAALSWILIWWSTEAIPIPATSLLPILLFPSLGILEGKLVMNNYSKSIIFMFMGGFFLASALERWQLHKRFAIAILKQTLKLFGQNARALIVGFMVATASLSMWISNTATTIMMVAIGLSIADFFSNALPNKKDAKRFNKALMLAIAYSASIGGASTLIGTPPNLFFADYLRETTGVQIDMFTWMKYGIPFMVLMLIICWIWLTQFRFKINKIQMPDIEPIIQKESANIKPLSAAEYAVISIFTFTALTWIFRIKINSLMGWNLSDANIAIFSSVLLFSIPCSLTEKKFLLDWKSASKIPWGILLMFGGGLSVAISFSSTGLTETLASVFTVFEGVHPVVFLIILSSFTLLLTELVTNSAAVATILPTTTAICMSTGLDFMYLAIPVTLACSAAFMFPISTPPNAIVFSCKSLKIKDMISSGLLLNIFSVFIIIIIMTILK